MTERRWLKPLRLHKPWVGKEEADAVSKVLDSGWLAEGEVTRQFEDAVATYIGTKHAIAICNCTVALELCLRAYRVTGSVVLPSFTHPATIQAIINAGCSPLLRDVDINSYNAHQTGQFRNIIYVSWAGNPYFGDLWEAYDYQDTCEIEDAACSLGSEWNNKKTGGSRTSCFSFHPRKLITTGEGGMVTTNDGELAERIRMMKRFGVGNYKLSDVNSAIGVEQMKKIDTIIARRREMAHIYNDLLTEHPWVQIPQEHEGAKHTYQTYAVYLKTPHRDKVIAELAVKGIETQIGTYALHLLPQYKDVARIGELTNSENLHRRLLALPMAYDMTDEDQKRVVKKLDNAIT